LSGKVGAGDKIAFGPYLAVLMRRALPSIFALVLGIGAGSVLIAISGFNPLLVFQLMITGAFGAEQGRTYMLIYMAPLILSALAFLVPGKAGMWNVGAQGQVYLGGMTATLIALLVPLPGILAPVVGLIAGALVGAVWAFIPALMRVYRNASEIVTTIMLNYVASSLASYLLFNYIGVIFPGATVNNQSPAFPSTMRLPKIPGTTASIMLLVAIGAAFIALYFLQRTTYGYKIRAVGLSPLSSQTKGINPRKMQLLAMALGGLLAGLAGAGDVLAAGHYTDQFAEGWFGGEGFAGIAVALVGASNPIGAVFSAVLFAIMVAGAPYMQSFGMPKEMIWTLQGLIILFTAMPYLYSLVQSKMGGKPK
jgi:ABC-type uncharacterized transport system permease subunit